MVGNAPHPWQPTTVPTAAVDPLTAQYCIGNHSALGIESGITPKTRYIHPTRSPCPGHATLHPNIAGRSQATALILLLPFFEEKTLLQGLFCTSCSWKKLISPSPVSCCIAQRFPQIIQTHKADYPHVTQVHAALLTNAWSTAVLISHSLYYI